MAKKKDLNLNDAFSELEEITTEFESGDLDLEESIPKFKRGLELAKFLKGRLSEVENEIIEIKAKFDQVETGNNDSEFDDELEDLDDLDEDEDENENENENDINELDKNNGKKDSKNNFDSSNHLAKSNNPNTLF